MLRPTPGNYAFAKQQNTPKSMYEIFHSNALSTLVTEVPVYAQLNQENQGVRFGSNLVVVKPSSFEM